MGIVEARSLKRESLTVSWFSVSTIGLEAQPFPDIRAAQRGGACAEFFRAFPSSCRVRACYR